MRVIVTARSAFANGYEQILQRLVAILGVISKNPSNPNFDQYIFESISALMRYVHVCNSETGRQSVPDVPEQVRRSGQPEYTAPLRTGTLRALYDHHSAGYRPYVQRVFPGTIYV